MWNLKYIMIGLCLFSNCCALDRAEGTADPYFVILVASYNNRRWYRSNLDSIFIQDYPYYRVIYIDDNSSDGTPDLVENYIHDVRFNGDFTLIRNQKRRFKVANFYDTIHTLCKDHEIIVELDGDDWFFDSSVLSTLATHYRNPIWMTYGQYIEEHMFRKFRLGKIDSVRSCKAREVPQKVIDANDFRRYRWVTMHLRTFKAWLFKMIKLEDLIEENNFFVVAGDVAMAFPMLEMAGAHSAFVSRVLYVYNNHSPLNDFRTRPVQQMYTEYLIRLKKPYELLDTAQVNVFEQFTQAQVDLIVISYDSPDNISKTLSHLQAHTSNIAQITIIYSDTYTLDQFDGESKPYILKPVALHRESEVKKTLMESLHESGKYVILMNDRVVLDRSVAVSRALEALERTQAHTALLHLNKNDISEGQLIPVFNGVYAWNLANNVDGNCFSRPYMALYRSKDLYELIQKSQALDGNASMGVQLKRIGLIIDLLPPPHEPSITKEKTCGASGICLSDGSTHSTC